MISTINLSNSEQDFTYAIPVNNIDQVSLKLMTGLNITEEDSWYTLKDGDTVSLFTIETDRMGTCQWALCTCSAWRESAGGFSNDFVYIMASRLDLESIKDKIPQKLCSIDMSNTMKPINMDQKKGVESLGMAHMANEYTWLMTPTQVMLNATGNDPNEYIDKLSDCYSHEIYKYTILSIYCDSSGNPYSDEIFGIEYYIAIYDGKLYYVPKERLLAPDGKTPLLKEYENARSEGEKPNIKYERLNMKYDTGGMSYEQVLKDAGDYANNVRNNNFTRLFSAGSNMQIVAWEKINGKKYYILYWALYTLLYVRASDVEQTEVDITVDDTPTYIDEAKDKEILSNLMSSNGASSYDEIIDSVQDAVDVDNVRNKTYVNKTYYNETENTAKVIQKDSQGNIVKYGPYDTRYYDVQLESGVYPDKEMNDKTGASYILKKQSDTLNTNDFSDYETLAQSEEYNLQRFTQTYVDGTMDDRQIYKINRFRLMTDSTGLSTKSFVFMTKPDLNLYKLDENNEVIQGQMNPSLLHMPEFKYIGRNKYLGSRILDSLEYWGTKSSGTPWLSIITNQAEGYSPIDREIGYTEVGETFHGHKVLYGKHDFKHNIAGTVTIPFSERRDLSLYYTLKIWTEYIHCLTLGLVEPHPIHIKNSELDYAVSLYYIQTDETMENIIYWEKLTGVFPLKCPDSFFEWSKGNPGKEMNYEIEFAYSMRSVLRYTDLIELDRLYMRTDKISEPLEYPINKEFNHDIRNNPMLAKMVTYFDNVDSKSGDVAMSDFDIEEQARKLAATGVDMAKFYYEPYTDESGRTGEYLANWLKDYQIQGIPYVKGPFVVPAKDHAEGKYLLKWV